MLSGYPRGAVATGVFTFTVFFLIPLAIILFRKYHKRDKLREGDEKDE